MTSNSPAIASAPKGPPPAADGGIPGVIDGRWRIDRPIGEGSFGHVFEATDLDGGQRVAVKMFKRSVDAAGYLRELGLLFSEHHPNVVSTVSFGYTAGRKYLVYEYLDGGSLRDFLVREPRVQPRRALRVVHDMLSGLEHAHGHRVVHRDLKPENVLLTRSAWPATFKLCDFGLSVRRDDGQRLTSRYGSPAYMAPEQFEGDYDHRVDFYALGVILYEMLFGRRPFHGDLTSLRHAHQHLAAPLPPTGPGPLMELVRRLLAKAPDDRPQDCAAVRRLLEAAEAAVSGSSRRHLPTPSFVELSMRRRLRASLEARVLAGGTTREGDLLAVLPDRLVRLGARGELDVLAHLDGAAASLADGCHQEAVAWLAEKQLWVWRPGDGAARAVGEIGSPVASAVVAPGCCSVAVATPDEVRLFDATGAVAWSASLDSYGTVPPVCFDAAGERLWVATDAPRTRVVVIDRAGNPLGETTPGANDVTVLGGEDHAIVGSRGRRTLMHVSAQGFVSAELELQGALVALEPLAPGLAAAVGANHLQVVRVADLRSVAMVPFRPRGGQIFFGSQGAWLASRDGAQTIFELYQLSQDA